MLLIYQQIEGHFEEVSCDIQFVIVQPVYSDTNSFAYYIFDLDRMFTCWLFSIT